MSIGDPERISVGYQRALDWQRQFHESQQQLDAANQRIAHLEGDKSALKMALESNTQECNHWAAQYAQEHEAREAAERKLAKGITALTAIRDMQINGWNPDETWSRALDMKTYAKEALAQIGQPQEGAISKLGIITVRLSDVKSLSDKDRRVLRKYVMGGNKTEARYRDEPEVRNILSAIVQHACNCGPRP